MLNYGGNLGHKIICGPIIYGINIARNKSLHWCSGKGVLKYGNSCCRIEP